MGISLDGSPWYGEVVPVPPSWVRCLIRVKIGGFWIKKFVRVKVSGVWIKERIKIPVT